MANYNNLDELIASEDNLTKLIDNTGQDDNTLTYDGVEYFKFKNLPCNNIYVSGNSFFGFSENNAELKVANRDGKLWNLSREEGTLYSFYKFLRFRWDGYTKYNSTSDSYKLTYDLFLFDTGNIYIHIINAPTNTSYLGTSSLVAGSAPIVFEISKDKELYFSVSEDGLIYELREGRINIVPPFDRKFLISDEPKFYKEVSGELVEISELENVTELTAEHFKTYGFDEAPNGNLLINLDKPKVYYFWDSELEMPNMKFKVTALLHNQIVETEEVDMSDSSILGIEKIEIDSDDETLYAISFDGGNTYLNFVSGEWAVLTESDSGMTRLALEEIGTDDWAKVATTGHYKLRFLLIETSVVRKITIFYINGGFNA